MDARAPLPKTPSRLRGLLWQSRVTQSTSLPARPAPAVLSRSWGFEQWQPIQRCHGNSSRWPSSQATMSRTGTAKVRLVSPVQLHQRSGLRGSDRKSSSRPRRSHLGHCSQRGNRTTGRTSVQVVSVSSLTGGSRNPVTRSRRSRRGSFVRCMCRTPAWPCGAASSHSSNPATTPESGAPLPGARRSTTAPAPKVLAT